MHINCCNANGPRAFAMIPRFAYQVNGRRIDVNLYAASSVEVELDKKTRVSMTQETNYPIDGQVRIVVEPEKTSDFTIALRIPAWSERTVVSVNGEPLTDLLAGAYLPIHRTWEKGDEITVEFLIGVLATRFQKYDVASRMVASILTSPSANARTKDKARELKDQILEELKSQKK